MTGSSKLADRLRAIVGSRTVGLKPPTTDEHDAGIPPEPVSGFDATPQNIEHVLGGAWHQHDTVSCFVVERRARPETSYGRDVIGAIAARLREAFANASLITGGTPIRPPFVFFDLETTGLSGGAGTYAFLIGCGSFDDDGGFATRQFVLLRHPDERQLLRVLATELGRAGALVTFNGKAFDAPLIETRYLFHRLEWTGGELAHLDILHHARRFWSHAGGPDGSCSLRSLERAILGVRRVGDIPGSDIPDRYFRFVRTGDPQPLVAVLEHNRLDLLSLAGLTARLLDLVRAGPGAALQASEALALGRVYGQHGFIGQAEQAYQRALAIGSSQGTSMASTTIAAVRALALLCRRSRRYEDAAQYWRQLLDIPICPGHIAREASDALAVHHEHRVRDLATAKTFALRSLTVVHDRQRTAWNEAARHRLARIERKIRKGSSLTSEAASLPMWEH